MSALLCLELKFLDSLKGNAPRHVPTKLQKGDVMTIYLDINAISINRNGQHLRFADNEMRCEDCLDTFSKKIGDTIDADAFANLIAQVLGYSYEKMEGDQKTEAKYKFF